MLRTLVWGFYGSGHVSYLTPLFYSQPNELRQPIVVVKLSRPSSQFCLGVLAQDNFFRYWLILRRLTAEVTAEPSPWLPLR
jgi:hypothetical protein